MYIVMLFSIKTIDIRKRRKKMNYTFEAIMFTKRTPSLL